MSGKKLTNSTPFAFIPRPISLEDRDELNLLPLNIMYASLAIIDGVEASGTALYEPLFASFGKTKRTLSMRYYNKYSEKDYIDITYYFAKCNYEGVKFVNGKEVLSAYGKAWKVFFIHLTMNGLAKGEGCIFEPLGTIR